MMPQRSPGRIVATVAATYAAWLVTCAISVGVLITWYNALLRLYIVMHFNKYGGAFYNDMLVLLLVLVWLALVVFAEGWFRRAANEDALGRTFVRATMAQLALGLLGYVVGRL
jgi:hypothetical protein